MSNCQCGDYCDQCRPAFCFASADAWREYDKAAEVLARKSDGNTMCTAGLAALVLSAQAKALIDEDPEAFEVRVRAFAYAQHMERSHEKFGDPQDGGR